MENDAEIFTAHYTWEVSEKGYKMASMMNKLTMMNSCEIILEKYFFFDKNHCEIEMHTILVCALYLIKYITCLNGFYGRQTFRLPR
jgi:hypothetical protein